MTWGVNTTIGTTSLEAYRCSIKYVFNLTYLLDYGIFIYSMHCKCGLERKYHRMSALDQEVSHWSPDVNTELVFPHCFGNVDIPNHVNYLETPEGTVSWYFYKAAR